MISRSSWLHLRIPFSYFLLPIFLFSLSISPNFSAWYVVWTFVIIHFFLYPASNGYNSYFDRDEGSIGGLKNPPPVKRELYYLSLLFDAFAILSGLLFVNLSFSIMLLVYGLVSKAYSHPLIRIKRHAITGWLITGFFQGIFTFVMCYIGINNYELETALKDRVVFAGVLTTVMLWANYPMTQIYQHEEDARRGDNTLSLALGIRGTFYFVGILFTLVTGGFIWYFSVYFDPQFAAAFVLFLSPVVLYFIYWFIRVLREESKADYSHTMWLNFLSATCMSAFFLYFFIRHTGILQVTQ